MIFPGWYTEPQPSKSLEQRRHEVIHLTSQPSSKDATDQQVLDENMYEKSLLLKLQEPTTCNLQLPILPLLYIFSC